MKPTTKMLPRTMTKPLPPRLLVVDAERSSGRLVSELSAAHEDYEVLAAKSLEEARKILETQRVNLLVTDMKLPDGQGLDLVPALRKGNPHAAVLVTGKSAKIDDAIDAFRSGASDFLPKPFTHEQLSERVEKAIRKQDQLARNDLKIARLKSAVRKLAEARRLVARKVDLLCNDLVGAYGEVSKQVDIVRTTEDFRKLCTSAKDLEQLLCHAMDWIMRRVGYANIAIYLAADETFQLGAYVKYTIPSSTALTDALREGVVVRAGREGFVRTGSDEASKVLTPDEMAHLTGQALIAANCTYLGESLATIVLFRDGASPFTNEDADTFRAIAPVLAIALASQVRTNDSADAIEPGAEPTGESPEPSREERADADWWKRGENPPF